MKSFLLFSLVTSILFSAYANAGINETCFYRNYLKEPGHFSNGRNQKQSFNKLLLRKTETPYSTSYQLFGWFRGETVSPEKPYNIIYDYSKQKQNKQILCSTDAGNLKGESGCIYLKNSSKPGSILIEPINHDYIDESDQNSNNWVRYIREQARKNVLVRCRGVWNDAIECVEGYEGDEADRYATVDVLDWYYSNPQDRPYRLDPIDCQDVREIRDI